MQDISELLERQHRNLRRLLTALDEEHVALAGNSVPAIEAASAAKQACLLDLEQDIERQTSLLARTGHASTDEGMTTYLRHHDQDGRLRLETRWGQIKELLQRCREQNSINGRIVAINQRHAQRALTILRGGGPAPEDCYGPRGQTNPVPASRSLGKV